MNVTTLEAKMLNNIANSCYGDFCKEDPKAEDSQTWAFEASDNSDKFTSIEKGVLGSLVKKELVIIRGTGKGGMLNDESTIEFTDAGVIAWIENN